LSIQNNYIDLMPIKEKRAYYRGYISSLKERYETAYWTIDKNFDKVDQKEEYEKLLICHSILHRIIEGLDSVSSKKLRNNQDITELMDNLLQFSFAGLRIVAFTQQKMTIDDLYKTSVKMSVGEPICKIVSNRINLD